MEINRRVFLAGACALGAGLWSHRVHGQLALGDARIDTVSDGHLLLPRDFVFGPMPQAELEQLLEGQGIMQDTLTRDCNVTLYRDGTNTVLFDAGSGTGFQDSVGLLPDALDSLGVAAEDVTHVVFTHGHPDHLWGVLDDFDEPLFSEAQHMMGRGEWEYWVNPKTTETIQAERQAMAIGAKRRMDIMQDQFSLFEDGDEILPGVAARLTPGHTPGHMAFEMRSGDDAVMVVGDAIGNDHVAFLRPEWRSGSDQDQDLAAETRVRLLEQLAAENMVMIGYHLSGGGIGRAERGSDGFRFVPEGT